MLGSTLLIVFVVELLGFPWSKTWASGIFEAVEVSSLGAWALDIPQVRTPTLRWRNTPTFWDNVPYFWVFFKGIPDSLNTLILGIKSFNGKTFWLEGVIIICKLSSLKFLLKDKCFANVLPYINPVTCHHNKNEWIWQTTLTFLILYYSNFRHIFLHWNSQAHVQLGRKDIVSDDYFRWSSCYHSSTRLTSNITNIIIVALLLLFMFKYNFISFIKLLLFMF